MPCVYILRCRDGSFYTGAARDLAARLKRHAAGHGARYTRGRRPVTLVWTRAVASWSEALKEEHRIKGLRRTDKEALVASARTGPAARRRRRSTRSRRARA